MNYYNDIIHYFDEKIKYVLENIDENIVCRITEIRIRRNKPIVIIIKNTTYFLDYNSDIYDYPTHNAVDINNKEFDELLLKLCNYSVYSSMESMKKGYISLKNGSRVGIASTSVYENNELKTIKDISSINIRIPKDVNGAADKVLNFLYVNSFPSIIISGKPNSGKTTLLRDLAYQLSNGFNNDYKKIAIIDERNEIAGKYNNEYSSKIGVNTDVLTGFNKSTGIEIATRTLSPEMIICDEISTIDELESIKFAFSSGLSFALSIHANSIDELKSKQIAQMLLNTGQFEYIVMLDNYTYQPKIIEVSEVYDKAFWNGIDSCVNNRCWNCSIIKSKEKI